MKKQQKYIVGLIILIVIVVGIILVIRQQEKRVTNQNTTTKPTEKNIKQYTLKSTSDQRSFDILSDGKIIKHIEIKDLPSPYDAVLNSAFDENQSIFVLYNYVPYDKIRNKIYFVESDGGSENNFVAIFSYNLGNDKISLVTDVGYTSDIGPLFLSPDNHYMYYGKGDHGGYCENYHSIQIFDLTKGMVVVDIGPVGEQNGGFIFKNWINNNSFAYATKVFDSREQCQTDYEKGAQIKELTYTIK